MYYDTPLDAIETNPQFSSPIDLDDRHRALREQAPVNEDERAARRVLVDVDGILFPFLRAFAHGLGQTWTDADCVDWKVYPTEHTDEEIKAALKYAHSEEGMRKYGWFDMAMESMKRLADHHVELVIATRRSEESGVWTKTLLDEAGVPYASLYASPDLDKIALAKSLNARVLIDDKPSTIISALEAGLDVLTLAWAYNDDRAVAAHERMHRANSWPELSDAVLDVVASNAR